MYCEGALDVSGVPDLGRFEKHHFDFVLGYRTMFDAARNDNEIPFAERNAPVAKVHPEAPPQHQEEFVFPCVVVPDKLTLKLHQLDVLSIQFADDARIPMVGKHLQLLAEVYLFHGRRIPNASRGTRLRVV